MDTTAAPPALASSGKISGVGFAQAKMIASRFIVLTIAFVTMPGALTPTEILTAYNNGADFVKLFPIANLGPAYVKAVRAPISHVPMMAVGGVNETNLREYLDLGMCGAGIGGNLVNKKWVENGEFEKITEVARTMVSIAKG